MTYKHGKDTVVLFDGYNLSAYFNEATFAVDVETAETTAFGSSAKTYIVGLKDGTASVSGMFDGVAAGVDAVLSNVLGASDSDVVTFAVDGGIAKGNRCGLLQAKTTSYEVSSPVGDVVATSADFQADGGIDMGFFVDATATKTATATQATSLDNTVSSANGGVANLHVTANTLNNSAVFVLQHSSDNSTFADYITFATTATGTVEGQRVSATGTVNRYTRTKLTTAGTGSITFTIGFARR